MPADPEFTATAESSGLFDDGFLCAVAVPVAGTLVLLLCIFLLSLESAQPLVSFFFSADASSHEWSWLTGSIVSGAVAVVFVVVWRIASLSWRWLAGVGVLGISGLIYLAWDEPVTRHIPTVEELGPSFPRAEASFRVVMRYGKDHPLARDFRPPQRIFEGPFVTPAKGPEWAAWLVKHRAAIAADWNDLEAVRAWFADLDTFDRIGDLTPARVDAEVISFQEFRSVTQHLAAVAGLQAIDGHGDEAIETLLPLLNVSRKLEPSARTILRAMIARTMQDTSFATANFILDRATVSPAMRQRLAVALAGGLRGEAGVRRLVALDGVFYCDAALHRPLGDLAHLTSGQHWFALGLNILSPLLLNRNRTANLYGDLLAEYRALAVARAGDQVPARSAQIFAREARPWFKNVIGRTILTSGSLIYPKILSSYWRIEDERDALQARLAAP